MAPLDRPLLNKSVQPVAAPHITLRRARRDDIPAIDAMHALSVQALGAADYGPAEIELFLWHLGTYDPSLIDDGTYFVLEHEGCVVGSGGWSQRLPHAPVPAASQPEPAPGAGERKGEPFSLSSHSGKIRSIFVHPGYARLGLGSRLVRHAEAEAVAAGHRLLELWSSLTGVPLYRKLGYQNLAPMAIPCAGGAGLPAVHMARLVPAPAMNATAA
jgi:GNAT superfamily N-acetyltransferase